MEKNEENNNIVVTLEDGKKIEAELIVDFDINGDNYVLYRIDDTVYGAKKNDDDTLSAIADDEWEIIEKVYQEYLDSVDKDNKEIIH